MSFTERAAKTIAAAGVPLETILADTLTIVPIGDGKVILKWTGGLVFDAEQAAKLIGG